MGSPLRHGMEQKTVSMNSFPSRFVVLGDIYRNTLFRSNSSISTIRRVRKRGGTKLSHSIRPSIRFSVHSAWLSLLQCLPKCKRAGMKDCGLGKPPCSLSKPASPCEGTSGDVNEEEPKMSREGKKCDKRGEERKKERKRKGRRNPSDNLRKETRYPMQRL